ncbi:MAG: aspartate kinase [Acidimicrobiia bacterium]|nr:aspartate kinase [Acidimicrobiia bacterium]
MSLVVQKYGGTSVAEPSRIREVADHIVRTRAEGHDVVVVVSAMGGTTDDLVALAHDVSPVPHAREYDMLLTAGERISIALLCMAILDRDVPAVSFTGSQAGIVTDTSHGRARIVDIHAERIEESLRDGSVVVVAGFQGVSTSRDITTLGRGGSDTTAVALAASLGAEVAEIYTDVAGVFTADPRVVPVARRLERVSYEEMLDMAATGSRVLALRSVEVARNHDVKIHVRSSFTWEPGTWVTKEDPTMEQAIISGVTHDLSEAKITIAGVPDRPGIAATVFRSLADAQVIVDMIEQNVSSGGVTDISFTVPREALPGARRVMTEVMKEVGATGVDDNESIARVSIVGAGMKTNPGVAAKMFETLAAEGVNIEMISTSSIRTSCVVAESDAHRAVRALHAAFDLGSDTGGSETGGSETGGSDASSEERASG